MCGIAGLVNLTGEPVTIDQLKKMTDAIIHRGPDDEGQWVEQNTGIGHRRLSIIDPSVLGKQPMCDLNERYVLSYNGEIYNFIEIRRELEKYGYIFKSKTDTEVVLNSLIHWGNEAVKKFNGMFAFVFFDRKEKKLLLARDRYGIKPLYYSQFNNTFAFGSEQKAITTLHNHQKILNKEALFEYFTFQNIFTDQTLVKDMFLLPAGHILTLNLKKDYEIKIIKYWDYQFCENDRALKKEEYIEELDRLFKQAVNRQLISDVELGTYLSGGMDSGSITAIASKIIPNIKTFTCGFDLSSASGIELNFDERMKAEAMSALFKTEHYEMVLKAGDMERCIKDLTFHLEEPRVGQSYPNYYASKLAGKFVKVVLSGTGGDELFGGYPWRYYRAAKSLNFEDFIDQYYLYWQRLVDNNELKRMFSPVSSDIGHIWTRDIFRDVFINHDINLKKPEDYINHSLYFEAKTFLHGLFLVEDKLSMAHSLENRVPFMDNDLVDFAMSCPVNLKLNNLNEVLKINENEFENKQNKYFKKTNDGKQILRDMMTNYIPESITKAEKQGFSSPDASWFKGESIDFVERILFSNKAKIFDILDKSTVRSLVNQHLEGKQNRRLLIWSLLNVETLLESF